MIENFSYGLSDEIGKGFSSKVFRGKNDITGELVAVKVYLALIFKVIDL